MQNLPGYSPRLGKVFKDNEPMEEIIVSRSNEHYSVNMQLASMQSYSRAVYLHMSINISGLVIQETITAVLMQQPEISYTNAQMPQNCSSPTPRTTIQTPTAKRTVDLPKHQRAWKQPRETETGSNPITQVCLTFSSLLIYMHSLMQIYLDAMR